MLYGSVYYVVSIDFVSRVIAPNHIALSGVESGVSATSSTISAERLEHEDGESMAHLERCQTDHHTNGAT